MELKQLRQFLMLVETLNFHKAAERLHIAQPPLSVSIRRLETEIGAPLFDRTTTGLRLTRTGCAILEHARRTLFHAEQLRQAAQLALGGQVGSLRLDFVVSTTIRLLPRSIALFTAAHPRVDLHLNESSTDAIISALRDGRTDIGLVRYPARTYANVTIEPVDTDQYIAALPLMHPRAAQATLRLVDLRDAPFIFPSKVDSSSAYASTLVVCHQAGFTPKIAQECSDAQSIVALVESGLGVALVPSTWQKIAPRAVAFKPLEDLTTHKIGLAFACRTDEEKTPLISNFRAAVLATI